MFADTHMQTAHSASEIVCNSPHCLKGKEVSPACWRRLHNCLVTPDLILNSPQKHWPEDDSRTSNIFRRPMVTIPSREYRLCWHVFLGCYLLKRASTCPLPSTSSIWSPLSLLQATGTLRSSSFSSEHLTCLHFSFYCLHFLEWSLKYAHLHTKEKPSPPF